MKPLPFYPLPPEKGDLIWYAPPFQGVGGKKEELI